MEKGHLKQNGVHLQEHEYFTVKLFLELGFDIELIPKSQIKKYRQPDIMMGGVDWEIKAPIGTGKKNIENSKKNIENILQDASGQSRSIIIDLFRSKMSEDDAIKGYVQYFNRLKRIKRMKIIKKSVNVKLFFGNI